MERLTRKCKQGAGYTSSYRAFEVNKRLAAYENILFTPDGTPRLTLEELRELVDSRPPCKVGDRVKVDARTWGNIWNYKTIDGGKFLSGEVVSITRTKKQTLIKIRVEHNVSWKRPMKRYPVSAMGVTVFLTREEAEAAMEGKTCSNE